MGIPWIQVYSNLPQHPKVSRLAEELKIASSAVDANVIAAGMLVCLWTWAVQNAHNGDLSGFSARTIASACKWKRRSELCKEALIKCGFIDCDGKLHDWDEYAGLFIEQENNRKRSTRARVAKYRESRRMTDKEQGERVDTCNADVTVTCNAPVTVTDDECNASTVPDHTIPDHNISCGDGDICACAKSDAVENRKRNNMRPAESGSGVHGEGMGCEKYTKAESVPKDILERYCKERGLCISEYFGASEVIKGRVEDIAKGVMSRFAARSATELDTVLVFFHCTEWDGRERQIIDNRADLLMYAFENASFAGHGGDWRYIEGILRRCKARGIVTLEQAEQYDMLHD